IEHSGRLNELMLPIKTYGITNIKELLKLARVGLRAQQVGKVPPIFHKSIPGVENIKRIFEKVEKKR
ncbi:MAG: succinate dehydrogenase, partial [Chloroflexi bacterium]|nr:succinate dehydrogenase [Chloroflexota bacterium]